MRWVLRTLLGLVCCSGLSEAGRAAADLSDMPPAEIAALQHRLSDAGCYMGAIDGRANAAMILTMRECPDQRPMLRIETGTHVSQIRRIGVDSACRLMATASDDKTVRLWAMPEGRLLQTIRLPIDGSNGGKVNAVALSPDGHTLAAGGWDAGWESRIGMGVYTVDLVSGKAARFGAFGGVVNQLAFSNDGSRIAVGLGGSKGLRILDRETGQELMADKDYGGAVNTFAFGPDGSLFTTSQDGMLRRYGSDLKLAAKVEAQGGKLPLGIAVDPVGRRVAVGYDDVPGVWILEANTLQPMARAETGDLKATLSAVTWSSDGQQLIAGGKAAVKVDGKWRRILRRFTPAGKRVGPDVPATSDLIFDLKPCGTSIAFSSADPSFGLLGPDGRARTLQGAVTVDARNKLGASFAVSADAASVRFGLGYGAADPVMFDLIAGTLADSRGLPAGLAPPTIDALPVTDWADNTVPKLGGAPIALEPFETSRSVAMRPDGSGFVLGTSYWLRAYAANGKQRWKSPVPSIAWGVNLSPDGRTVVAAFSDGTIRWFRWSDGQELLALFVHVPTKRWVAFTPTGYYMASPGAEDMIGWHLNRGWAQEADFFPASRFRDRFNRPDIVQGVLRTLDEAEAVSQANAAAGRHDDQKPLIERLPPVITILSPSSGNSAAPGTVDIRYRVRLPSGGTIDRIEAFVDGAKIEARGLGPASGQAPDPDGASAITLPMPAHDAVISLVAYADGKASDAAKLDLKGAAPGGDGGASSGDDGASKPTLYALLVGVAHYQSKGYDLAYPAQDALGLAEALKLQKGRLYKDVVVKVLTDQEATTIAVKRGLSWLRKQTTAHDLAIVFAAGHGTTDAKGKFWFLTYDMDPDDIGATAVSRDDISDVLFDLPGKKLLFLDACHAGAALNAGARGGTDVSLAISDFAQTEGGVVAYAASTGREFSFEDEKWGHGAFTKALIEGLGGRADLFHKGTITTATLDLFLETRVKELTDGRQHPVMTRPNTVPDFPIAIVQ